LRECGYSLQANSKTIEGKQHPDRDAQFRHINQRVKAFQRAGQPAVSVDTKKKEPLGKMKNPGRTYRKKGDPEKVKTHDFPDKTLGKAVPYGVYDFTCNEAGVSVGISHDTAEFAVERQRVFAFDWLDHPAPAPELLEQAVQQQPSNGVAATETQQSPNQPLPP
jgi:hypothetical protein